MYPRQPSTFHLGHIQLTDDYGWLSDYEAARPYLQQEQRHFEATTRQWSQQARQLLQDMEQHLAAVQLDDPPEQVGPFLYFSTSNPHGPDTILRRCTASGGQQVVLSAGIMQQDAAQASRLLGLEVLGGQLGNVKLSSDHRLLAYSLEVHSTQQQAAEQHCCIVRDINAGRLLPGCVLPSASSFEWSADSSRLYYCQPDQLGRPRKVFSHVLRQAGQQQQQQDELLFTEADPKHFVTLTRTKDWRYVLINSHAKLSSEVHLIDAAASSSDGCRPLCVQARRAGLEYFVEHWRGHLLLLTNHNSNSSGSGSTPATAEPQCSQGSSSSPQPTSLAPSNSAAAPATGSMHATAMPGEPCDYCLMTLPAALAGTAGVDSWRLLLPAQLDAVVTDMDVFDSCVVLHELRSAQPGLRLLKLEQQQQQQQGAQLPELQVEQQQQVQLPGWAFAMRPGINQDYDSSRLRLYASSPAVPELPLELHLATAQLAQLQQSSNWEQQQPQQQQQQGQQQRAAHLAADSASGHEQLVCKRLWAAAPDGAAVPVTLLHSQGFQYDGSAPLLVEVYGAYGQVLEADFRAHRLALLQRGWAVALAHVRGGGEGGRRWHAAGRQLRKPNSVSDLLACLQLLLQLRVTSAGRIAGHAASAGGLTLAAAVNASPQLFSAVVLEAPFVDWAGSMCNEAAQHVLTEHEADEWGNAAQQPQVADMVARMCPYNNLQAGVLYPAMLVTAGLQDTRVPFWMPVKYVAKLRSLQAAAEVSAAGRQQQQQQQVTQGRRPILLQFADDGGHFSIGQSGGAVEDIALQYAFLITATQHVTAQQAAAGR